MIPVVLECARHGSVEIAIDEVTLGLTERPESSTYSFRCPGGDESVTRVAAEHVVKLLAGLGCAIEHLQPSTREANQATEGDLVDDVIIDFRLIEDAAVSSWLQEEFE